MSERVTRLLRAHGRVQGVWFRESMRQEAERLGITGWVRNRMDGTVEALVQGAPGAVEAIVAWTRRGPRDAQVRRVEVSDGAGAEVFARFEKRPTA
jgi:acylphosphatase